MTDGAEEIRLDPAFGEKSRSTPALSKRDIGPASSPSARAAMINTRHLAECRVLDFGYLAFSHNDCADSNGSCRWTVHGLVIFTIILGTLIMIASLLASLSTKTRAGMKRQEILE